MENYFVKTYRIILYAILVVFFLGCATTDDLNHVRGEVNYRLEATNEKLNALEKKYAALTDQTDKLSQAIRKTEDGLAQTRTSQAESRAAMTEIQEALLQIRGLLDDMKAEMRREISSFAAKTKNKEETEKRFQEKIEDLAFKINFIENFLGIGKKDTQERPPADTGAQISSNQTGAGVASVSKSDKATLYAEAFALFKEGKYEKSREAFENFLKQYPNTEFSDNAQFWVGECYYFEKKYEKAIVEYDKVIKNFPGGNKVSYALLKQGLSFLKLGDKASAKLLLQQVTKDYPNTSQARIARAKLLEIK